METENTNIEDGDVPGGDDVPGDSSETPAGRRRIASYLARVHVYANEGENLVAETNDAVENAIRTQLGYTYGRDNVSVKAERLDK
jgi:hypothetical protein